MAYLAASLLAPIRSRNNYNDEIPDQVRDDVQILFAVGTAAGTAAFVADRRAVRVLPAPKFHFLLLGAFDASLAHLPVVLNLGFGKFSVLPEDDVEAESEYAETDKYNGCNQYLHQLMKLELISSWK